MNSDLQTPEQAKADFKKTIDWMKSVAQEKMKTVEGCRWLEEHWRIRVEYPPTSPHHE